MRCRVERDGSVNECTLLFGHKAQTGTSTFAEAVLFCHACSSEPARTLRCGQVWDIGLAGKVAVHHTNMQKIESTMRILAGEEAGQPVGDGPRAPWLG
jgi:hypothetical protein